MREIWLVFRREFLERVAARSFVIGTLLFPTLIAALIVIPGMLGEGEERHVVVVDETESGVGQLLADRLTRPTQTESANRYEVEMVRGSAAAVQTELTARVQANEIDGFLVVPADVFGEGRIRYRSTAVASPGMMRDIQIAASESVRGERLRLAGIEMSTIAEVVRPVQVENVRLGTEGEERGGAISTFVVAYILAFAIYFLVFFYGVHVMRSVLEEKTSRIAEVLVSSIRSTHLMAGKILGVAGAALLQVSIWVAVIALLVSQSAMLAERFGIDDAALAAVSVGPGTLALLLAFFLLGFFLYAALFAALGASVTSEQEAQAFQMVLLVPLLVPLLFLVTLASSPLGSTSTFLGLFPLTAPVAMPMRLAASAVPASQIVASLAVLVLSLIATAWLAGRIYRIGILSTGSRPTLRELVRWLRVA